MKDSVATAPEAPADRGESLVEIGVVSKPHGIRGELVVVLHDTASEALFDAEAVVMAGQTWQVEACRPGPAGLLLKLAGIGDRDLAGAQRGHTISMKRSALDLDDDDVLLSELVGCRVVTVNNQEMGIVAAVEPGFQDRLVIHHEGREIQLPVVDEFIAGVDLERGVVTIDPPEGLPSSPLTDADKRRARRD